MKALRLGNGYRRTVATVAVAILATGCASMRAPFPTWADVGQGLDCATTVYGLNHGAVELNPLVEEVGGIGTMCAIKMGMSHATKIAPNKTVCEVGQVSLTAAGFAAASWNVSVIAAGTGLYGLPVAGLIWWLGWDAWIGDAKKVCNRKPKEEKAVREFSWQR